MHSLRWLTGRLRGRMKPTSKKKMFATKLGKNDRPPRFVHPIDFVPYGLDRWQGTQCLDTFVHGSPEPPSIDPVAIEIWLAHQTPDLTGGVRVGTFDRERTDRLSDGDPITVVSRGPRNGRAY